MTILEKRLLGLMQWGCVLQGADGHIWIECANVEHSLDTLFNYHGIVFNNKIYGGVLEALDTIDEALKMCGRASLETMWDEDVQFLGNHNVAKDRIMSGMKHHGGFV